MFFRQQRIDNTVLQQARRRREIVHGGHAVQVVGGILAHAGRNLADWDLYSPKPRTSADLLNKTLNKSVSSGFFIKRGLSYPEHGTMKVMNAGPDHRRNTADDESIADYSRHDRVTVKIVNGVRYESRASIRKHKEENLRTKRAEFRREKDEYDIALLRS